MNWHIWFVLMNRLECMGNCTNVLDWKEVFFRLLPTQHFYWIVYFDSNILINWVINLVFGPIAFSEEDKDYSISVISIKVRLAGQFKFKIDKFYSYIIFLEGRGHHQLTKYYAIKIVVADLRARPQNFFISIQFSGKIYQMVFWRPPPPPPPLRGWRPLSEILNPPLNRIKIITVIGSRDFRPKFCCLQWSIQGERSQRASTNQSFFNFHLFGKSIKYMKLAPHLGISPESAAGLPTQFLDPLLVYILRIAGKGKNHCILGCNRSFSEEEIFKI